MDPETTSQNIVNTDVSPFLEEDVIIQQVIDDSWQEIHSHYKNKFHEIYTPSSYESSLNLVYRYFPPDYVTGLMQYLFGIFGIFLLEEDPERFTVTEIIKMLDENHNKYEEYFDSFFARIDRRDYFSCTLFGPIVLFTLTAFHALYTRLHTYAFYNEQVHAKAVHYVMSRRFQEVRTQSIQEILHAAA